MSISAKMILDSISPQGHRLRTMQICAHRFILAEINTHRMLSRNFRSSRAVPVAKLLEEVRTNPALPVAWLKNKPGMQGGEPMNEDEVYTAKRAWQVAAHQAANNAEELAHIGLHKQWANRGLEPYLMVHGIITATDFNNFYTLRRHPDAQPEIKSLADAMWECEQASEPRELQPGEWHLPYVSDQGESIYGIKGVSPLEAVKRASVARVARVSYKNHDGSKPDIGKDLALHDMLLASKHMSPFEHQATPDSWWSDGAELMPWKHPEQHGNLTGWIQYRKTIPNEWVAG